ncbi:tyrosine-protein kinase domain-containing protein [Microbacterium xylanilyticum]
MTFRQILAVLWARKWIVVVIVLFALIGAGGYIMLRTVTYMSEETVRMNTVISGGATSDDVGGVAVSFGAETIVSPDVLDAAGTAISERGSDLVGMVKGSLVDDGHATNVVVSATGATPKIAQQRAAAVVKAYEDHIGKEMARVLEILQKRKDDAIAQAQVLQGQVRADPSNSIAATNLATELSRMSSISTQIDSINNSGAPTSTLIAAQPGTPTVPSALVVVLLALSTGLIVGIAAALIRDQFDNRIRDEEDVEALLDVPVIGSLTWDRDVSRMAVPLPVASNDRTNLGEGLRTVRSTLQVLVPPGGAFVVTSVEPGDGKSFASANLALAWARAGKRVILVGGDLRRPDLSKYFGEDADGEGLSEILNEYDQGSRMLEDALLRRLNNTRYRRLRILAAGSEPAEPADLLARAGTAEVVAALRGLADVVVIDTPPAMGMSDSSLLASHTDGAVVIATEGRTDRARLAETISGLVSNGVSVLGVVINRSRRKLPRTYASYYLRERRSEASGQDGGSDAHDAELGGAVASPKASGRGRRRYHAEAAPRHRADLATGDVQGAAETV